MTLSSRTATKSFNGDGVNKTFDTTFPVWKNASGKALIVVTLKDPNSLFSTTTNFTTSDLTGNRIRVTYPQSGNPLPTGWSLTITRDMDFLQPLDIPNNSPFLAEVVMSSLDKLTAQDQQLLEAINRSVKIQPGSTDSPDNLLSSIHDVAILAQKAKQGAQESEESAKAAKEKAQSLVDSVASALLPPGAERGQVPVMGDTIEWKEIKKAIPGGEIGQALMKQADGNAEWSGQGLLPDGGEPGQKPVRQADGGIAWENVTGIPDGGEVGQVVTQGANTTPEWQDIPYPTKTYKTYKESGKLTIPAGGRLAYLRGCGGGAFVANAYNSPVKLGGATSISGPIGYSFHGGGGGASAQHSSSLLYVTGPGYVAAGKSGYATLPAWAKLSDWGDVGRGYNQGSVKYGVTSGTIAHGAVWLPEGEYTIIIGAAGGPYATAGILTVVY